ncbi:hypothetical protein ACIQRE_20005 [Streptomyces griseoluteus]|uniref:hypothetical protein n=1 Tax=Streptomyces griseoluteus TaxID=29306 RepID=UPI00381206B5
MYIFVCAGCGARLTVPLSQVALPAHAHQKYGNGVQLPVLMESGTFAVDPERRDVSDGIPGDVVIAPGDARGTVLIPEQAGGYCCGLDWGEGPNMACEACGLPVASRIDDCSLWQGVWLAPDAVRALPVDGAAPTTLSWAELLEEDKRTPPYEPIARWSSLLGSGHRWSWSPQWEAAAGRALAHLLAASGGLPVTVPHGLTSQVFQRALDALLPGGGPARHAVLAGPGLPGPDPDAGILLVPVHPRTGETWSPPGRPASACAVPLPFGVWLCLAFPEPQVRLPAAGSMPEGVLRDDPPAPRPPHPFRVDPGVFRHTLTKLPAAGAPWLREILGNLTPHLRSGLF